MSLNINGDFVGKLEWKNDECASLSETINNFDCVFISEAWTNETSCVDLDGYITFRKERVRRARGMRDSGGLICYFKNHLARGVTEIAWEHFEDGMCFKLDKNYFGWSEDVYLLCVYMMDSRSTRQDINAGVNCYDVLLEKIASISDLGGIVLLGDMNARCGSGRSECLILDNDDFMEDFEGTGLFENVFRVNDLNMKNMSINRVSEDVVINDYGRKLLELTYSCDLISLSRMGEGIGRMTFVGHQGESAIDHCFCSKLALQKVENFKIHKVNHFSDHCVLSFDILTGGLQSRGETGENACGSKTYAKWDTEKKNEYIENLRSEIVVERLSQVREGLIGNTNTEVLESSISELCNTLLSAGSGHVRNIKQRSTHGGSRINVNKAPGWYDEELRHQARRFREGELRYYENRSHESRVYLCAQRNLYRKMCRSKKKVFNRNESERLYNLSKSNSRQFWKEVKGGGSKNVLPNLDFYNHFKNLAERETQLNAEGWAEIDRGGQTSEETFVEELDSPFSLNELEINIKGLKTNKAAGSDLILNEFILNASQEVKLLILTIFNQILSLEYFPENWSKGEISAIFKQGDVNNTNNYRGITVLSCLGKLFTRMLNNRLTKWTEDKNVLFDGQYGFRKGRSTVDCLFILNSLIEILFSRKKRLFVAFIDYEKAYDYLSRAALWVKLLNLGVSSKCIRIYKSMYSKMNLCIKHDPEKTFPSLCGVLQGESSSPLLFALFINDLENALFDVQLGTVIQDVLIYLLLFADDMAVFSETREGLQRGLNKLGEYCMKWGIKVNTRKTKVVVFRKGGQIGRNDVWDYLGENIEVVPHFKYLGCFLSSGGSFTKCITELVNSARRALFSLRKYFSKNQEILTSMKLDMFNAMISPILFYGSEIWGSKRADEVDIFHRAFLKSLLNVRNSTPNCFVYGELGVFPLFVDRQVRVISYWTKLLSLKDTNPNSLTHLIYKELFEMSVNNPRANTWATSVRDILNNSGFGGVWVSQTVLNKNEFLSAFKQRVRDMYLQNWSEEVAGSSTGRLFRYLKEDFKFEPYLNLLNRAQRIALTRIRLSSHIFNIERGRWARTRTNRGDRLCSACSVLECEFHCLVQCPRYVLQRNGRLPERLRNRPCMFEFLRFLKSENETDIRNLAALCLAVQLEYKKYV